jgi:hypothetical protein
MKYLFVPTNLNLRVLLPQARQKHIDKYHYFIHKIYEERILNKLNDNRNGYVSIYSKAMEQVINTRQYSKVLRFLIENHIIETDDLYSNGGEYEQYEKKCKWYRLTDRYASSTARQMMIDDTAFEKKITYIQQQQINNIMKNNPLAQYINFNLNELRIDSEGAFVMIGDMLSSDNDFTIEQYNIYNHVIHKILNKDFFLTIDDNGRIHNNLTNLPRILRKYLYIDPRKELVNLDIRNSQPLIMAVLIREAYKNKELPMDCQNYIYLCEQGIFYDKMMDLLDIPNCPIHRENIRKDFKQDCFGRIFYCRTNENYTYKESKAFKKEFPNVYDVIVAEKKGNYKKIANKMQQYEAQIMIKGVMGHLQSLHSDFFALCIHDSILTTKSNSDYVKQLILDNFGKYEIYPTINSEFL